MYVGVMHGVIAARAPEVRVIDLAHDIRPQNLAEAALCLEAAADHFPRATVFCCVVDPGVGSARRALAAWDGRCFFVAPDNGVLTLVEQAARERATARTENSGRGAEEGEEAPEWRVRVIDPYRLGTADPISATFHGRDLFAPVAATLARGGAAAFETIGDPAEDWARLECPEPDFERVGRIGQVGQVGQVRRVGPGGPCGTVNEVNPVNPVNPVNLAARETPIAPPEPNSGEPEALLVTAHVLAIDSFGNAITTLRRREWDRWWRGRAELPTDSPAAGCLAASPIPLSDSSSASPTSVSDSSSASPTPVSALSSDLPSVPCPSDSSGVEISLPGVQWRGIARTFCDVASGQPVAYWGSGGRLEIGLRDGNAAARFSIVQGTPVALRCPFGPEREPG